MPLCRTMFVAWMCGQKPMIHLKINDIPVLFIKAFNSSDVQTIVEFVREAAGLYKGDSNRVLFIDTPITSATVEAVGRLKAEAFKVVFRDHHGIDGEPTNDRERRVVASTDKLQRLLGKDCHITIRRLHPACSTLVSVGEFTDAVAIIADPDADGLTAAMKAAGISYPGLDDDAAKLDGEPQFQVTGTPMSQFLAKGIATIPSYDSSKPKAREEALQRLFEDWVQAVTGSQAAAQRLDQIMLVFDEAVLVAESLSCTAVTIAPGVVLVDVADKPLYDPGTLNAMLESDPTCRIIVLRKSLGPIAALHGIQYSLSVAKQFQDSINLHTLVPGHAESDPEAGVIANVSFLLHVNDDVWQNQVLPKLKLMS
jgi:hypothetical protein